MRRTRGWLRWPWSGRSTLLVGAVVMIVWNGVFDSRMHAAICDYVDRQQLYVAGQGPRVDIDAASAEGVRQGLRDATLTAALVGGLVAAVARRSLR